MSSEKNYPNNGPVRLIAALVAALLLAHLLGGCAPTYRPKAPASTQASWDGTNQNSGLIGFAADGSGVITAHARDRYNALAYMYGYYFRPPVHADDGVTPTATNHVFFIDPQHLAYFATMNRWLKEGRLAPNP